MKELGFGCLLRILLELQMTVALMKQPWIRRSTISVFTSQTRMRAVAEFDHWASREGIRAPKCAAHTFSSGLRGLIATDDISDGEVVMEIPLRLCLAPNTGHLFKVPLASEYLDELEWPVKLALRIVEEHRLGGTSQWWPYICSLPRPPLHDVSSITNNAPNNSTEGTEGGDVLGATLPVHWDEDFLELVESHASDLCDEARKAKMWREYRWQELYQLQKKLAASQPASDLIARDEFEWALDCVQTRNCRIPVPPLHKIPFVITTTDGKSKILDTDNLSEADKLDVSDAGHLMVGEEDGEGEETTRLNVVAPFFDLMNHDGRVNSVFSLARVLGEVGGIQLNKKLAFEKDGRESNDVGVRNNELVLTMRYEGHGIKKGRQVCLNYGVRSHGKGNNRNSVPSTVLAAGDVNDSNNESLHVDGDDDDDEWYLEVGDGTTVVDEESPLTGPEKLLFSYGFLPRPWRNEEDPFGTSTSTSSENDDGIDGGRYICSEMKYEILLPRKLVSRLLMEDLMQSNAAAATGTGTGITTTDASQSPTSLLPTAPVIPSTTNSTVSTVATSNAEVAKPVSITEMARTLGMSLRLPYILHSSGPSAELMTVLRLLTSTPEQRLQWKESRTPAEATLPTTSTSTSNYAPIIILMAEQPSELLTIVDKSFFTTRVNDAAALEMLMEMIENEIETMTEFAEELCNYTSDNAQAPKTLMNQLADMKIALLKESLKWCKLELNHS